MKKNSYATFDIEVENIQYQSKVLPFPIHLNGEDKTKTTDWMTTAQTHYHHLVIWCDLIWSDVFFQGVVSLTFCYYDSQNMKSHINFIVYQQYIISSKLMYKPTSCSLLIVLFVLPCFAVWQLLVLRIWIWSSLGVH